MPPFAIRLQIIILGLLCILCSSSVELDYYYARPESGEIFEDGHVLGRESHSHGIKTEIHLFQRDYLRILSQLGIPERESPPSRHTLDLLPVRLSVFNTNREPISVRTECFQIQNLNTKES